MKFSILVLGSPLSSQAHQSALRFTAAALRGGHQIYRIFFFDEAAAIGNTLSVMPQDEASLTDQWQTLAQDNSLDMVVCVSSALKRGILDSKEAERYEKPAVTLPEGFEISGLGQLVDATLNSDRVITFGA